MLTYMVKRHMLTWLRDINFIIKPLHEPIRPAVLSKLGLGGIAILVLDISYRKIPRYYYLSRFLQNLWIDCSIRVFRSFSLIWFCKYQTFVFNSVAITILVASKEFLDTVKPR